MIERDWTHDEPPRKIWLQWYDDDGKVAHPEDRTYTTDEERIKPYDICFVRWGKTAMLEIESRAWKARAEAAESALAVSQAEARGMNALYDASVKVNETLSKRVAELEARLAEMEARADRNQGSADVLDTMEELMFGWEDDD